MEIIRPKSSSHDRGLPMTRYPSPWPAGFALALLLPLPAAAQETPSDTVTGTELTVYNENLALVEEQRRISLDEGVSDVSYRDVAARLQPTSVTFRSLRDPEGTSVLEQNFEYDLVSSDRLLQKYIDHTIAVELEDGSRQEGELLSTEGGVVLRTDGGVRVLSRDQVRSFDFPELPGGLRTRPTLVWTVRAEQGGSHPTELAYLTEGMGWQADYVVELGRDDESMSLRGWVTLDNESGKTYEGARLKLVAGDIHRAADERRRARDVMLEAARAGAPQQVDSRSFFEYHLYEITRPVTVENRQTKQIEFVTAERVDAEKRFVYRGTRASWGGSRRIDPEYGADTGNEAVEVYLHFRTSEEAGLDRRLPAGRVRVYQEDVDGSSLLIGEDRIDHTPKDEDVQLTVGQAFDLVGERVRTDYRRISDDVVEEDIEIRLRNRKSDEDVTIRVVEPMYRASDWTITRERMNGEPVEHERLDSHRVEWQVPVAAGEEATLTYTVRYRW